MLKKLIDFLASYALACVLLTFLFILTLLGTLEQVDHGLYEVQRKYFEGWFLVHEFTPWFHLPLPGVYPLMVLLFINLTLGALIRAPKSWTRPGMLIAHGGILLLLVAGFVTYEFSNSGHMTLYEGQSDDHYQSYYDWVITITDLDANPPRTWEIPHEEFHYLTRLESRTFHAKDLPFMLFIEGYMQNSMPVRVPPVLATGVDGVNLEERPLEPEAERNIAGAIATVIERPAVEEATDVDPMTLALKHGSGEAHVGLLWGMAAAPWIVNIQDKRYAIDLRHERFPVPFTITLDKFIHEKHPRTGMASNYQSEVTMTEGGSSREVDIKMNEPLRHKGFTFFQASFIEQPGNPRIASVFAVVNNPADQWPKYACYVIGVGLCIHFLQRLTVYLRSESRRRKNV
ncbi:MAG: hypothetical protein RLZZ303_1314 [Candidatus Hydrogenedentota bacterium]